VPCCLKPGLWGTGKMGFFFFLKMLLRLS
jgi:hypothetical protein